MESTARPDLSGDVGSWLARIDRLRVEDRPIEAMTTGWTAYRSVPAASRPEILRALTLALLAAVPESQASSALRRRVEADPDDLDARVALLRRSLAGEPASPQTPRIGRTSPRPDDALGELRALLARFPDHPGTRAALVDALLDGGRVEEARSLLRSWPGSLGEDPRLLRLQARIDLDFDDRPARASEALARLLALTPHDWQVRAQLARALERQGDSEKARDQARLVDRLRERLDPDRIAPRLAGSLAALDDPEALADLAALCRSVGLTDLATAWRLEASARVAPGSGAAARE